MAIKGVKDEAILVVLGAVVLAATLVLGWSWGTVTASLYAKNHPEHLGRLVLYAPILSGIGAVDVKKPFHHNTWEHAASDFQMTDDGTYDLSITDPVVIEEFCSSC